MILHLTQIKVSEFADQGSFVISFTFTFWLTLSIGSRTFNMNLFCTWKSIQLAVIIGQITSDLVPSFGKISEEREMDALARFNDTQTKE